MSAIRFAIGRVAWRVYLWGMGLTEAKYWEMHEEEVRKMARRMLRGDKAGEETTG